ncbi:MAG TPA: triose-phosphate isomerase [Candidatus Acidoferrales bacterium]|nr:triose-phosphate isomerase [Candidatus Acidoferrales bacterium]
MTRRPLIAGNWKMHKTTAEARAFVRELRERSLPADVEVVICPPFTALDAVGSALRGSQIALGAQTMHEAPYGPFTGEISPLMLRELGVTYVILGHSERRRYDGETDAAVARKTRSALRHGLTPIIAVGETSEEHESGAAVQRVTSQTQAAVAELAPDEIAACVFAYEPIWAIGTGLSEDPPLSDRLMQRMRTAVPGLRDARLLYGGSMNPKNAAPILAQPNIDGGLIGGASLAVDTFVEIIEIASPSRQPVGPPRDAR